MERGLEARLAAWRLLLAADREVALLGLGPASAGGGKDLGEEARRGRAKELQALRELLASPGPSSTTTILG